MPKRGGKYQNFTDDFNPFGSNDYDDRLHRNNKDRNKQTRRVSFKPTTLPTKAGVSGALGKMKDRLAELAIRSHLENDDDMDDYASTSKHDRTRRKGSPIPKGKFGKLHKIQPNQYGWYQVTINNAQVYSKDEILRAILEAIAPDTFIPFYWRNETHCAVFFVNSFKIAERIQDVARNIQFANGFRVFPKVRNGIPLVPVDDVLKARMLRAMVKRYNAQTQSLDLTKFYADPDLTDTFCGLSRHPVMSAVLNIIQEHLKDLRGLNLSENCLSSLETLKNLETRLPHLKILYLAKNRIPAMSSLMVLRNVPLIEINLENNPLCSRYRDNLLYISEVRRKFPKLLKLDGKELEKQILFDDTDTALTLPKSRASFLVDPSGAEIIRQFLEQYFLIFDSNSRQPLLDAYHEHAQLSVSIPPAAQAGRLSSFWKFNRNLKRFVSHDDNRQRQLRVGRLKIVTMLQEWPKTLHDKQTFSVDLSLFTPQMIIFSVDGFFKEVDCDKVTNSNDIRYFHRMFIIVPAGGGFCIRNEMITLSTAPAAKARTFMNPSTISSTAASTSTGPSTSLQSRLQQNQTAAASAIQIPTELLQAATISGGTTTHAPMDEATKLQMVQALCTQTHMNIEWSRKCLEETHWDYNNAIFSFEKLHKAGNVPPEAFVK